MFMSDKLKPNDSDCNKKEEITSTPEKAFFNRDGIALKPLSEMKLD